MNIARTDYGQIIKTLRKEHKWTQSELGEKIGGGKTLISNYETGYSLPSLVILEKLADAFDMTLGDFLQNSETYAPTMGVTQPRHGQPITDLLIPYLKPTSVTTNVMNTENYMDSYVTVPGIMLANNTNYVCVKVPDNSMENDGIRKNDYAVVHKTSIIENNKIMLAIHNTTGNYIIRRCHQEGHIVSFLPSSSSMQYSIIRADLRREEFMIAGCVEKAFVTVR